MNKSVSRLCLTAAVAFIAGIMFAPMAFIALSKLKAPGRYQKQRDAVSFFYKTMNALFEGTYSAEEDWVSPDALKKFREYETQLGGKCELFIVDSTPGYYECVAFFPSGDIFSLAIVRRDGRWVLSYLHPRDWERFWRDALYRYRIKRDSDQHSTE